MIVWEPGTLDSQACTAAGRVGPPLGKSQGPITCTFTMFKFLLRKHASTNSLTSSGPAEICVFAKCGFTVVKPLLHLANVYFTKSPEGCGPCRRTPFWECPLVLRLVPSFLFLLQTTLFVKPLQKINASSSQSEVRGRA